MITKAAPLFLSHWDASIPICIPANTVEALRNYQIMGVRFLYDCFQRGQKGAILNHEPGMNFQIQISAFLNALHDFIQPNRPVLIICQKESVKLWQFHLLNHGGYKAKLLNSDTCHVTDSHLIILTSAEETKVLREIKNLNFFCVVVDELDKVVTKRSVKSLKSAFNIGLTNHNFLKNRDQKLMWAILNWCNYEKAGKLEDFCVEEEEHLNNLRCAYDSWWHRLTWNFSDHFQPPTDDEQKQLNKTVQKEPPETTQKQPKKRKSTTRSSKSKRNKRKTPENIEDSTETEDILLITENSVQVEVDLNCPGNFNDSQETIVDEDDVPLANLNDFHDGVKLEPETTDENEDNPILRTIMSGYLSPERSTRLEDDSSLDFLDESKNVKKEEEEDDILMSIIKN